MGDENPGSARATDAEVTGSTHGGRVITIDRLRADPSTGLPIWQPLRHVVVPPRGEGGERDAPAEGADPYDLSRLSPEERARFLDLLAKARAAGPIRASATPEPRGAPAPQASPEATTRDAPASRAEAPPDLDPLAHALARNRQRAAERWQMASAARNGAPDAGRGAAATASPPLGGTRAARG